MDRIFIRHPTDGRLAHVDAITQDYVVVGVYADDAAFLAASPIRYFNLQVRDGSYAGASAEVASYFAAGGWIVPSEIDVAKERAIRYNREECRRRIMFRYPIEKQLSALAGVYPPERAAEIADWVDANVKAENAAADAIDKAKTLAAVEEVTVAWPV